APGQPQGADHVIQQRADVPLSARGGGVQLAGRRRLDDLGGRGDRVLERGEQVHSGFLPGNVTAWHRTLLQPVSCAIGYLGNKMVAQGNPAPWAAGGGRGSAPCGPWADPGRDGQVRRERLWPLIRN